MAGTDPYWLIREPGKAHGFGSIEYTGDPDPSMAVLLYLASLDDDHRFMLAHLDMEAVLVRQPAPGELPVPVTFGTIMGDEARRAMEPS